MTTPHDVLKQHDITPTIDAERAYRLGCEKGYKLGVKDATGDQSRIRRLEQVLTEIGLMVSRTR